uniref:Uncharacterized protein n=1 Tax=Cyanoderma ruficeps TaxID=181631 RepID=A0A8C3X7F3_9PASS
MRRFGYCRVVLATSLLWVLLDVFLLLYFSECNKCEDSKERSLLPALRGESCSAALSSPCQGFSREICSIVRCHLKYCCFRPNKQPLDVHKVGFVSQLQKTDQTHREEGRGR